MTHDQTGGWLHKPEESRCALEDLIGSAQLTVLPLQLGDAGALVSAQSGMGALLVLFITDPLPQGLASDAELLGDRRVATIGEPTRLLAIPGPTAPPVAEVRRGSPSISPWLPSFLHGMEPPRISCSVGDVKPARSIGRRE